MQSKVPEVDLGFWIIKILATTLGETGGDTVSMTMDLGHLIGTAIFLSAFIVLAVIQIAANKFHPALYWSVIVASTTAGTTMADFATRSLGIGYTGGALLLFVCLIAILAAWYWSEGSISVPSHSRKRWAPRSAIGQRIPAASVTKAPHYYSVPGWRSSPRYIF